MAKSRVSINPLYKGGAGGFTFYVRGGEQVVRQRKNNSNYGETASRTRAQMLRRIRWGNLVNCYKAIALWQKKAYDSKVAGQTDYNIFMQLNINRVTVGETKEMCEGGCAVFEGYQVSRGSLAPVLLSYDSTVPQYVSGINITQAITTTTTIGALSTDILANNPEFLPGDNIAIVLIRNYEAPRVEWPFASSVYAEITLDAANTALLSSIPVVGSRLEIADTNKLSLLAAEAPDDSPLHEVGAVMIHTRKSASLLKVSSQSIVMADDTIIGHFSGSAWDDVCINSYGTTEEAPLEPSFKGAVIEKVAINGSEISDLYGRILTYTQPVTLVLTGIGMNSGNVYVEHDGVRYTPLVVDGDSWTFILGSNGTNRIYVNGSLYGGIAISGIAVPEFLPTQFSATQRVTPLSNDYINNTVFEGNCINYPHLFNESYPVFSFRVGTYNKPVTAADGFEGVNCSLSSHEGPTEYTHMIYATEIQDPTKPAYITYQGFIVAVFNYTE